MEFLSTTDLIAIGVLKALKELKIKVPSQVKVFGYDNSLLSEIATTPIATVEQPIELMSEKAAEMLGKTNGRRKDGRKPYCGSGEISEKKNRKISYLINYRRIY